MNISVRNLHNDMIKPSDNGRLDSVVDSMINRVMIRDTPLRYFIIPNVRKMTPRLRHICGCEIFMIPKDTYIDLNIFKTKLVSELQQNSVDRHTHNSAYIPTSAKNHKETLFLMVNFYMILSKM